MIAPRAPGIREELRNMARRIAEHGYFCLLPDMYTGSARSVSRPVHHYRRRPLPAPHGGRGLARRRGDVEHDLCVWDRALKERPITAPPAYRRA
ncbi:MAG TPA: dienelactone hydrolase family protein, partial [Stellaceae bacterium]|nr:dienelactone hydrolase family protein [Stellaceae bacterium]